MIDSWRKKLADRTGFRMSGRLDNSVEDLESFEKKMAQYFNDSNSKWMSVR
ncbi:hypothetical protein [Burkholderia stabilis]